MLRMLQKSSPFAIRGSWLAHWWFSDEDWWMRWIVSPEARARARREHWEWVNGTYHSRAASQKQEEQQQQTQLQQQQRQQQSEQKSQVGDESLSPSDAGPRAER